MTVRVCSSCPSALVGISRCCFLQRRLRALEAGAGGVVLEALCWWLVDGGLVVWSGGWWWGCWDFLVVPLPGRLGSSVWLTCWCLCACRSEVDASRAEKLRQEIGFTEHTWPLEKVYEYYGGSPEGGLSSAQVLQNRYVAACVVLVVSVVSVVLFVLVGVPRRLMVWSSWLPLQRKVWLEPSDAAGACAVVDQVPDVLCGRVHAAVAVRRCAVFRGVRY